MVQRCLVYNEYLKCGQQVLNSGEPITKRYFPVEPGQHSMCTGVYSAPKAIKYVDDRGSKHTANIMVEMPDATGGVDREVFVDIWVWWSWDTCSCRRWKHWKMLWCFSLLYLWHVELELFLRISVWYQYKRLQWSIDSKNIANNFVFLGCQRRLHSIVDLGFCMALCSYVYYIYIYIYIYTMVIAQP